MDDDLMEQFERYRAAYGWRARLERFRAHLDKLPDQRRRIPIKGGHKTGPRVEIEKAIDSAEQAGEAGDLDRFAQAIHRIVGDFFEAGVEIFVEAGYRKKQSQNRKGKKSVRQKSLASRGLMAMLNDTPDLTPQKLRDHLDGCTRHFGSLEISLMNDDAVCVLDSDTGEQDFVVRDQQGQGLRRAKQYNQQEREHRRKNR